MKIIVFGANGQLGKKIQDKANFYLEHQFVFTDIEDVDITNKNSVECVLTKEQPDVIINCAAYTAVDKAESEPEKSQSLNADAVEILANVAKKQNIFFIHVSTDYVFDGKNFKPYTETDQTNPISIYGKTKRNGEQTFWQSQCCGVIIRTAWLYSEYGNNFVKTMMRLGKEKSNLNVVCDQVGTPTYAGDLADAILKIALEKQKIQHREIFHYSNHGAISWYDFAKAIMEIANLSCSIQPIPSCDYPTAATRPFYSVLDKSKIIQSFNLSIPYWKDSLVRCIEILKKQII